MPKHTPIAIMTPLGSKACNKPPRKICVAHTAIAKARATLPKKSISDWTAIFRSHELKYLVDQISQLAYNESLPNPDLNMRPALMKVILDKKAAGETIVRYKPTYVLPSSNELDGKEVKYERQKCGGKGQTILVPVID